MASVEIILKDDKGNVISNEDKRTYELDLGNKAFTEVRFDDIERAVNEVKLRALKDIESDLLKHSQEKYIKEELKKKGK